MIYISWDIECDRLKLVIMGHFLPFYPLKTQKIKILKKWKKLREISSFYTCVPKTTIIWGTVPEIWSERNNFLFWAIFCTFTSQTTQKIKILKNWKKYLEISSFYTCVPKIMIIWCMLPETWSATDITFCHFGPFFDLFPHYWS